MTIEGRTAHSGTVGLLVLVEISPSDLAQLSGQAVSGSRHGSWDVPDQSLPAVGWIRSSRLTSSPDSRSLRGQDIWS